MKAKYLSALVTLGLSTSVLPAANIAWVSLHPADDTASVNAVNAGYTNGAPDKGYTALLAANGHNVTRFPSVDLDATVYPDLIAAFNTNDLIIVSRSVGSGQYELAIEAAAWNGLTAPLMSLNGYINRANRLGFNTGNTIPDVSTNSVRLRVLWKSHPVFAGLALNSTNLMVNPFAQTVSFVVSTNGVNTTQRNISVVLEGLVAGGMVLARVGTPGDAAFNGVMLAEFPAGTISQRGDVLGAKRFVFLTGSREHSGGSGDNSGIFDLSADGAQLFLKAVTYLTTTPPPLAPECTVPLVTTSNVLEGDSWTFSAGVVGDSPRTYQWYKDGVQLPSGNTETLVFTSLTASDAGQYQLFVTNSVGWATSTLAWLQFKVYPAPSVTNSLISYWPLDGVLGIKTIDRVSGYDMSLNNMNATHVMPGKWGNAFQFYGSNSLFLSRINAAGDALPIYNHPDFTVSLWVNGLTPQTDRRVYSEGSTVNNNPLFNLGTHNTGADGTVDIFIRTDGGAASPNHAHSLGTAIDGTWHNIVYVQRDAGGGDIKAQVWIDGVLDSVTFVPARPLTLNTTSIGGILRAAPSAFYAGMIDEVAAWNRDLSPQDIAILQVTSITNPPSRLQPLAITTFKADLPAVVNGGSTTLRWDVSKDATQVLINPLGDVTAQTTAGAGSRSITQSVSATYVLTVNRGVDSLSATTSVAVVNGVAPGWTILDTFDQAALGNLFSSGYWNDTSGNGGQVVDVNGNRAARITSAGISFLNLRSLSIQETQKCTLFFRVMAGEADAAGVTNIIGLTDKSQRSYGDSFQNIGPVVIPTPFINSDYAVDTNGWYLGARNTYEPLGLNESPPVDYNGPSTQPVQQPALEAGAVYNVWVDITNAPLADSASDIYSVYVQKEGGAPRTALFKDFLSDRDLTYVEPVLGGIAPVLDKLILVGNSANFSAVFDDFYLSRGDYNATVPKPYTILLPPGPLSVGWSGNQLQINWSNGTLQASPNVIGPYVDVPGNPASPYLVAPTGAGTYYRTRQ